MFSPLIVAPLSELYGRLLVYHAANILFVLSSAAAALSRNINVLIACRFLLGLTVASTTLNSCIVGDMFKEENRGRALAIMGLTPAIAPVLGPAVGGYISQYLGWRWTFWVITIATGVFELLFLVTYRETYKVTILERKARRLRMETGNGLLRSRYDTGVFGFALFCTMILRPFKLLFTSPVIVLLSICGAFAISYTYVVITSISGIYTTQYHFSQGFLGLTYLGLGTLTLSPHHLPIYPPSYSPLLTPSRLRHAPQRPLNRHLPLPPPPPTPTTIPHHRLPSLPPSSKIPPKPPSHPPPSPRRPPPPPPRPNPLRLDHPTPHPPPPPHPLHPPRRRRLRRRLHRQLELPGRSFRNAGGDCDRGGHGSEKFGRCGGADGWGEAIWGGGGGVGVYGFGNRSAWWGGCGWGRGGVGREGIGRASGLVGRLMMERGEVIGRQRRWFGRFLRG